MFSTKADEARRGLPSIRAWQVEFVKLEVAGEELKRWPKEKQRIKR